MNIELNVGLLNKLGHYEKLVPAIGKVNPIVEGYRRVEWDIEFDGRETHSDYQYGNLIIENVTTGQFYSIHYESNDEDMVFGIADLGDELDDNVFLSLIEVEKRVKRTVCWQPRQ